MKVAWLVSRIMALAGPGMAQDKAPAGELTKSPTEHTVNQPDQPIAVRSMHGLVSRKEGYHEPLPIVLFEIQGPRPRKNIRRATIDERGRFKLAHVPAGTLKGFQSVMGITTISKKATTENEIRLEMQVGV
jgi:hypothetical protein